MCLGVPMQIVSCEADRVIAETLGVRREISLALLETPRPVPGDYVMVHVGYAIARVDAAAAEESWAIWQAMNEGEEDA